MGKLDGFKTGIESISTYFGEDNNLFPKEKKSLPPINAPIKNYTESVFGTSSKFDQLLEDFVNNLSFSSSFQKNIGISPVDHKKTINYLILEFKNLAKEKPEQAKILQQAIDDLEENLQNLERVNTDRSVCTWA